MKTNFLLLLFFSFSIAAFSKSDYELIITSPSPAVYNASAHIREIYLSAGQSVTLRAVEYSMGISTLTTYPDVEWFQDGVSISPVKSNYITVTSTGLYGYVNPSYIGDTYVQIYFSSITSVDNSIKENSEVSIFPTVCHDKTWIEFGNNRVTPKELTIIDGKGQVIRQLNEINGISSGSFDMSDFSSGIYYFLFTYPDHRKILKVVKN